MEHTLSDWLDWYFEVRDVTAEYERSVRYRAGQLEAWAGRKLTMADLTDTLVNQWVKHLQANTALSPKTIKGYRESVLQVWRAAAEEGKVETRPSRIRRISVPKHTPIAWHLPEIAKLREATEQLPGVVKGTTIPRSLWYLGHFDILYDTGFRRSDALKVRWRDLRPGNIFYAIQSKTGEPIPKRLSGQTMGVLWEIRRLGQLADEDPMTPWPGSWRQYEHWLRWVVAKAAIRPGRTKWIRRSAASYVEKRYPGQASAFLGHKTPGLAQEYYLDPSIVHDDIIVPPRELWDNEKPGGGEAA